MLTELEITDILGSNNINNNTPFLIVSYKHIQKFLVKIWSHNNYNIFSINYKKLVKYIKKIDNRYIDIDNFIPVGNLCSNIPITSIILANKYTVSTSQKYKKVGRINNLVLWTAHMKRKDTKLRSIGVVVTNGKNPPNFKTPVLPRSYLIKMEFPPNDVVGNEFNILNYKKDGLWIISRSKFSKLTDSFKLLSLDNKYLSSYNNTLQVRDSDSTNQNISYNAQGELVMDDMCIEAGDNVKLSKCNKKNNQKWIPYNGNLLSSLNGKFSSCLGVKNNKLITKKCNLLSDSDWDFQNTDFPDVRNYNWAKTKIKPDTNITLVNRDDPWFINKDIVGDTLPLQQQNNTIEEFTNDKSVKNFTKDTCLDNDNNGYINDDFISFLLVIILIIIILYRLK
jgi:hypothetical protein